MIMIILMCNMCVLLLLMVICNNNGNINNMY